MQGRVWRTMCVVTAVLTGTCALCPAARAAEGPLDPLASLTAGLSSPIRVEATLERGPDGEEILAVTAILEEGWHLYSLEQKPGGPKATKITVAEDSPQRPTEPFRPTAPPARGTVRVRTMPAPAARGLQRRAAWFPRA